MNTPSRTIARDLNSEISGGETTQGETAAYLRRSNATVNDVPTGHFSGEESSYVAVIQSLLVSLIKSKSSAKFCRGSHSPLSRS